MKILFVKESLQWPRSSGHDVHCFHMMEALGRSGEEVALLTAATCTSKAIEGLKLAGRWTFDELAGEGPVPSLPRLQEKYCNYWGIDKSRVVKTATLVDEGGFDAVVVVGLNVLPYLALVSANVTRVWYAADEWLLHHWSQFKITNRSTWGNLQEGLVKGLYEYAFTQCTDRVWVVSNKDASAVRWVMPKSKVDVIANGVDAAHYDPTLSGGNAGPLQSGGLVFWGRLDFGPNIDAIDWFCKNVWAKLTLQRPDITWTVYGFQAGKEVRSLAAEFGFELIPDLPDLRSEILKHKVVVLPFVSGAGIKNKFLEAASMARAIVASTRALNGVELNGGQPCCVAGSVPQWLEHITRLCDSPAECKTLGESARQWVRENYSWERAAILATHSLAARS